MTNTQCILVGLGGNLSSSVGSPATTLQAACDILGDSGLTNIEISSLYQSTPIPASDQPDFINCALKAETRLSPDALLHLFQATEKKLGRHAGDRWSARTCDIDLLAYGDSLLPNRESWCDVAYNKDPAAYLNEPVVPHPRLHRRAFVLVPLCEIAPEWKHPYLGKTISDIAEAPDILAQAQSVVKFSGNQ